MSLLLLGSPTACTNMLRGIILEEFILLCKDIFTATVGKIYSVLSGAHPKGYKSSGSPPVILTRLGMLTREGEMKGGSAFQAWNIIGFIAEISF